VSLSEHSYVPVVLADRPYPRLIHPLHAFLLAGTLTLFLGALICDIAYFESAEVQWKNFASWLIVGGLVFGGFALLCSVIDLFRHGGGVRRPILYFLLLLAVWVLGFGDELIHAKDAWASMPESLYVSAIVALLAILATGLGLSTLRTGA